MSIVYRLKASELDRNFLEKIKAKFADKEIEIVVSEIDETAYLLKSESNKNQLLKAIENIKNRQDLVEMNLQELERSE
jgi:antitoxin YefM